MSSWCAPLKTAPFPRHRAASTPAAKPSRYLEELLLADLGVVENRLEKLEKARLQKRQTPGEAAEHQVMTRIKNHLDSLEPVRSLELTEDEKRSLRGYMFVSGKPLILVANVGEDEVGEELPA